MGCDIHAILEVKTANAVDGKWETIATLHLPRQYAVFCRLAGVRCDAEESSVAARGLPADLGYWGKGAYGDWKGDAHSASWLTATEFAEVIDGVNRDKPHGFPANSDYDDIATICRALVASGRTVRIVFWFDN